MSIRSGLRTYLASQPAITAIVGPSGIYPVRLPQTAAVPALLYRRETGGHDHVLTGSGGHALANFRLDCVADKYADVDALAEAVRQALQGFSGSMGDATVRNVILEDEHDDYVAPLDGSDVGLFVTSLTYRIRYTESVPAP